MLKIWLTWLQPSLGLLGTALVLSQPFYAYAATKPLAVRQTGKTSTQSQWSSATIGAPIDKELLTGIPATPDFAVRQLAINAMATPRSRSASNAMTLRQSNQNTLAGFISPSTRPLHLAAKSTKLAKAKPQQLKNSVALALARAINPQTAVPVPGLFIGNSSARVAKRISPAVTTRSIAATEIGAPTPLSAMMAKAAIGQSPRFANDPFPVVRPETMQKLQQTPLTASATRTTPYALNPIAAIPSVRSRAVVSKSIVPKTTTTQQSLDPIAAIPSGLQRLLGNNLNSQPIVASVQVAKAISIKPRAVLALKQLASRTVTAPSISANSLQLATAQAYTSVPKFDIPGEKLVAATTKPFANLLLVKRSNLTTAAVTRKSNYAAIFTPTPRQSWTVVTQQNNLGGLILGSQPLSTMSKVVISPATTPKTSTSVGLPARKLTNFN